MSARACSRRSAPGLRYPVFRTLVALCRTLGAALPCSDKPKRGATRHPSREVCAADRERSRRRRPCRERCRAIAPRPATDRRPARVSGIRHRSGPGREFGFSPEHRPGRKVRIPKTRAEPVSTVPLPCPDLRIQPLVDPRTRTAVSPRPTRAGRAAAAIRPRRGRRRSGYRCANRSIARPTGRSDLPCRSPATAGNRGPRPGRHGPPDRRS